MAKKNEMNVDLNVKADAQDIREVSAQLDIAEKRAQGLYEQYTEMGKKMREMKSLSAKGLLSDDDAEALTKLQAGYKALGKEVDAANKAVNQLERSFKKLGGVETLTKMSKKKGANPANITSKADGGLVPSLSGYSNQLKALNKELGNLQEELNKTKAQKEGLNKAMKEDNGQTTEEIEKLGSALEKVTKRYDDLQKRMAEVNAQKKKLSEERTLEARSQGSSKGRKKEAVDVAPDLVITEKNVKNLTAYDKLLSNVQKKAKAIRPVEQVMAKPLNNAERTALEGAEKIKKAMEAAGKRVARDEYQRIFEQVYLSADIKKLGDAFISGSERSKNGGYVSRGGFNSFYSAKDQKMVPNFYRNNRGEIVPQLSHKVHSSLLGNTNFPEYKSMNNQSINTIAEYYDELMQEGTDRAIEYAQQIFQGVMTAFNNTKEDVVVDSVKKSAASMDWDTKEFFKQGSFWSKFRAQAGLDTYSRAYGNNDYEVFGDDVVQTSKDSDEDRAEQARKEEAKRVKTAYTGAATEAEKQIRKAAEFIKSPQFYEMIMAALSGGVYTDASTTGVKQDFSGTTPNELRSLVSNILSSVEDATSFRERDSRAFRLSKADRSRINYADEENVVESEYDTDEEIARNMEVQAKVEEEEGRIRAEYISLVNVVYDRLKEMTEGLTDTQKAFLAPTISAIEGRLGISAPQDGKQLVNSLSNSVSFGKSVLDPIKEFARDTGTDEKTALRDAYKYMDENVRIKISDSLELAEKVDDALTSSLEDFKSTIKSSDLASSEDQDIAKLAADIETWNLDDLFMGLSRLSVIQANFARDLNSNDLGEFGEARTQLNAAIEELQTNLFDRFTSMDSQDKNIRGAINGVKQFRDDWQTFSLFLQQFYGETFTRGARSINFNEEEANKQKRGLKRPTSPWEQSWDELAPKQRYLQNTKAMSTLALYGADINNLDAGIENAEERIADTERKIAEEGELREAALKRMKRLDEEIARQQEIIEKYTYKYPSKDSKTAVGGYKIEWDKAREDPSYDLKELTQDRQDFVKAQSRLKRLRDMQKSESYLDDQELIADIGDTDRTASLKKQLERFKADLEFLVEFRKYAYELTTSNSKTGAQQSAPLALPPIGGTTRAQKASASKTVGGVQDTQEVIALSGKVERALGAEEDAVEAVNQDLKEHSQAVQQASEAEQAKVLVSQRLEDQLGQEGEAYQKVNAEAKEDARFGKMTGMEAVTDYTFNQKAHSHTDSKGNSFYSLTQLRDFLLGKNNPTFKADRDRIETLAQEKFDNNLGPLTVDDIEGMDAKDFKFMTEGVIGSGIRGDLFHGLIDRMIQAGYDSIEQFASDPKNIRGSTEFMTDYQNAVQELQKYGIEEAFLGLDGMLESYIDMMRKSGMSPTKFSEKRLAFKMTGDRGDITVGLAPDQLFSMGNGQGAFVDNKSGGVKGYEAFQLTGQILGTLANLDTELKTTDEYGNVISKKVREMLGDIDAGTPFKTYIADVKDGMSTLIEYLNLSNDEFYNLAMDAQEIAQGRRQPLTKEEQYSRMNRQLKTGRYVGVSSDYMDAEIIEPNQRAQMAEIRNFIQMYRQRLTLEREIAEKEEQIKTANTDQAQQLHEQLASRKRQLQLINEQMPKESHITQTMGDVSMDRTMIGDTMLDYEMAEVLKDLKAREEGRSDIKLKDRMAAVFKRGQTVSNKEQVGLVREYVNAYKDLYELELKLSKAEGALNLGEMAGVEGEELQKLRDTVELLRNWRDDQRGRVEEFGLDEKNAKFGFDEGQIKLSKKNAQKLYSDLEDIWRKYTENQSKAMDDYSKKVRSQETKLNEQLIKAAKRYYDDREKLQKIDLDVTKNPELAKGLADNREYYQKDSEKALKNMQDIVRLANEFNVDMSSGFDAVQRRTAEYRDYTANMGAKKSAAQGTGVGAQKLIQEYIANLKQQYHIEQQIHALELKMQDQSGAELKNSQAYMTSLQAQLNTVKQMAPVLNTQERKLNGIELTEEQITNILKQQSALYQTHQVQLDKINARQRESRGLLTEIVTGFRQAFKNLTDASIAYEIIGQIKMGITTLIQTTKELDASMSDLRIASGATKDEMHDMMLEFTDLGAELGRTTQDVSQAANDWLRAGYAGEEAAELTKASAQLSTLGMINTADATSYLISVLKGWKIEAAEVTRVVDKLTAVDLAAAISAGRDSLNTGRPVDRIKIAS